MEVRLAKTAGFCFGVRRAVDTVYEQVEQAEGPIYTYGPIVHNEIVVQELEEKGVKVLNSEEELKSLTSGTVIIRAHGVGEKVYDLLKQRGETVCFAESLTGGRIAASVVDCPGASDVLKESFVTYCDSAKARVLGVSEKTLSECTAVSAECAREMADGARRISGADWGVSATGVSGKDGTEAYEFHFTGSRDWVRTLAKSNALNRLRLKMQ